jgi:predicted transcriptional regulator
MPRSPAEDVTDTELAILEILWDRQEATRRHIADTLYPGGAESHYATVQNLLGRLEKKSFVTHEPGEGNALVFKATISRDTLIRRRLQTLADKLCGGAVAPLVMNLVRSQPLSAAEVEELSAILRTQKRRSKTEGVADAR